MATVRHLGVVVRVVRSWTTDEGHLVVFTVQNLVGIVKVVSIICKFLHFLRLILENAYSRPQN